MLEILRVETPILKVLYCMNPTDHSVHEVHGFEFPAKTIFANNLKTIDLRVVYYVYLSLAQLSWSQKSVICICTIDNIWNKAKKIFANWVLSQKDIC